MKGNFSILKIYSGFADSPPLYNREEFKITLFITVFKLRKKQCTYFGLKTYSKCTFPFPGPVKSLNKICELDNKLMSFGAIFNSSFIIKGFFKQRAQ